MTIRDSLWILLGITVVLGVLRALYSGDRNERGFPSEDRT